MQFQLLLTRLNKQVYPIIKCFSKWSTLPLVQKTISTCSFKGNSLAQQDDDFKKFYNITNHQAVKLTRTLECSHWQQNPDFETYRSEGRADHQKVIDVMSTRLSSPVCHANYDNYFLSYILSYIQTMIF